MFETEMSPMFAHYSSEVPEAFGPAGAMHGAEWLTWKLNGFNRLQEWGIRRAVFTSELDRVLSVKGQSLAKLEAKNMLGTLDPADIKSAVSKSLDATWAKPFDPTAKGAEGVAGTFIKLINGLRLGPFAATQLIPFPRFMMNSFKWQYERTSKILSTGRSRVWPIRWAFRRGSSSTSAPSIRSSPTCSLRIC
jgi:hypothetical protein